MYRGSPLFKLETVIMEMVMTAVSMETHEAAFHENAEQNAIKKQVE